MTGTERHRDDRETPTDADRTGDADRTEDGSSGSADQRSTDTFEGLRTDEDDVTGNAPS